MLNGSWDFVTGVINKIAVLLATYNPKVIEVPPSEPCPLGSGMPGRSMKGPKKNIENEGWRLFWAAIRSPGTPIKASRDHGLLSHICSHQKPEAAQLFLPGEQGIPTSWARDFFRSEAPGRKNWGGGGGGGLRMDPKEK